MLHPRLTGVIRAIFWPTMPADTPPQKIWQAIRPTNGDYLKNSFWYILGEKLPYARSSYKQVRLANWIWEYRQREERAGRPFPPLPIEVKPAVLPQPRIA